MSRLDYSDLLSPEDAADMIEDIPDAQAADLVEDMPSEKAAAILEELDSDHLVDVLAEMDEDSSRAILDKMDKEDADEARKFLEYPSDCAGGLMISEFLKYKINQTIQDVLDDMQLNRKEYIDYHVLYFFVVDFDDKLVGVLRMHDLLFPSPDTLLTKIMIKNPLFVNDTSSLKELEDFFDEHHLFGVPVVDSQKRLVGVVLPNAIEEEVNKKKTKTFLKIKWNYWRRRI